MSPDWRSGHPRCRIPVDVDQKTGGLEVQRKTGIPEQPRGVLSWSLGGGTIPVKGLVPLDDEFM